MNKKGIALRFEDIRVAEISEFGKPFDTLELRHAGESKDVPTVIDVLFFEPTPAEQHPEEDWYTYLLTCGLATRALPGAVELIELVMSVRKRVPREGRHRLARRLAELGTIPFRDQFEVHSEMVLEKVSLPLFERMDHVVLSLYGGGEYLPTNPPVALLDVTPVFASEAEQIRKMSVHEAFYRFAKAGIKRDNPDRKEVDLASLPPSST